MSPSTAPLYRIHVAAERAGLTEGLLRAWERRYGILTPKRTPGGYRAYTGVDIELLRRLRQLTEEGVSIAEAAQLAPALRAELEAPAPPEAAPPALVSAAQVDAWRRDLLGAMHAYDQARVDEVLDEVFAALPPQLAVERVLGPLKAEIGASWARGTVSIAEEHLVTASLRNRLARRGSTRARRGGAHVVCACLPEESHELGLMAAAQRLREAGVRVTSLGARTPALELARVVRKTAPDRVLLSAVFDLGAEAFRRELAALVSALPAGTKVAIGGLAALAHPKIVAEARFALIGTEAQWGALVEALQSGR